jgi:hypothetical protein
MQKYYHFSFIVPTFQQSTRNNCYNGIPPFMRGEPERQLYERTPETYYLGLLFRGNRCPVQGVYNIQTNVSLIEQIPSPVEELLTVAIDDSANTFFLTGITGFRCH